MTDYRERLAPELRPEYDAAVQRAGQLLASAYADIAERDQHEAQAA